MGFPLSRALSAVTAGYGAYCLLRPAQLADALGERADTGSRRLALTYAGRDLPSGVLTLLGPDASVPQLMSLRIAADLGDAATLGASTSGAARSKALGITLGWATLNAAALWWDLRDARPRA